jgi:hypothetical protein
VGLPIGFLAAAVSSDFATAEGIFGRLLGKKWHGGSSSNPTGYTPLLLFRSNDKESKLTNIYIYIYIYITGLLALLESILRSLTEHGFL